MKKIILIALAATALIAAGASTGSAFAEVLEAVLEEGRGEDPEEVSAAVISVMEDIWGLTSW